MNQLKKIRDYVFCTHPAHDPPPYLYFEGPGVYEYACPGCGEHTTIVMPPEVSGSWNGKGTSDGSSWFPLRAAAATFFEEDVPTLESKYPREAKRMEEESLKQ